MRNEYSKETTYIIVGILLVVALMAILAQPASSQEKSIWETCKEKKVLPGPYPDGIIPKTVFNTNSWVSGNSDFYISFKGDSCLVLEGGELTYLDLYFFDRRYLFLWDREYEVAPALNEGQLWIISSTGLTLLLESTGEAWDYVVWE